MLFMLIQQFTPPEHYPTAVNADIIIIYIAKTALVIAFFYGMKYWVSKSSSQISTYTTWILGIWFLFYQPFTLFHGILMNTFVFFDIKINEPRHLGVMALILGVIIYWKLCKIAVNRDGINFKI